MRLLADTTYLLPAIGVAVKGLPGTILVKLFNRGDQVSISEITLFELCTKGAKYVAEGRLTDARVSRGVRAVVYDERITHIPIHDSQVLGTAFRLRRMLNDFIDCLILSSAMNCCDALLTEDEDIQNLVEQVNFREFLQTTRPEFKVIAARMLS